jgi:hypothetical protein
MSRVTADLPGDPGLWERFRSMRDRIVWHPLPPPAVRSPGAIAHRATLHEQSARREIRSASEDGVDVLVDSGPLGALLLLLEWDERGGSPVFSAVDSGEPEFPEGAIVAHFGGRLPASLPVRDILDLARFALP